MKAIKIKLIIFCVFLSLVSCSQESRHVSYFKNTEAYELAKAVEDENLQKIETLVKANPKLLNIVSNSVEGSNVLSLCIYIRSFESFKKLLELKANPNSINKYSKESVLMIACTYTTYSGNWQEDYKYAILLLEYGADASYTIENEFEDERGNHYDASSVLTEEHNIDLNFIKLLIKYGADYKKRVEREIPFGDVLSSTNFETINYFIDTLKIDVHEPLYIRDNGDKAYVQDYIKQYFRYPKGTKEYTQTRELIKKLKSMGLDFKNYNYNFWKADDY